MWTSQKMGGILMVPSDRIISEREAEATLMELIRVHLWHFNLNDSAKWFANSVQAIEVT